MLVQLKILFWTLYFQYGLVKVKVEQGWLEGESLRATVTGKKYYSFTGVPYAEPPLGKLRFQAPRPPIPWDGVRDATKYGSVCTQRISITEFVRGSEDCLFLNVYTPDLQTDRPLPVMFFIHGGFFQMGSGNSDSFGPDFLINHNVIVVTINYRLGVLGFLSLGTRDVPGNAGLKDQISALNWVRKNIQSFGGDPNNITVFGQSAGSVSVSLLLLSPMAKGLFNKAILMSGVFYNDWAMPFKPELRAFVLGEQLGKKTKNVTELYEFLQNVPSEQLVGNKPDVLFTEKLSSFFLIANFFTPVVECDYGDDHYITENLDTLLRTGKINDVDLIIGHTNEERAYFASQFDYQIVKFFPEYPELLVPRKIILNSPPTKILKLSDCIHQHYFGNKTISFNTMREFINFFNDFHSNYDILRYTDVIAKFGNKKRYFYVFSGFSERNVYGVYGLKYGVKGASHSDDLMYIFNGKKYNLKVHKKSKSYKMIEQTTTLFTNFAKYGNPTPDLSLGVMWKQYGCKRNYLNIDETLTLNTHNSSYNFWKGILKHGGIKY